VLLMGSNVSEFAIKGLSKLVACIDSLEWIRWHLPTQK